MPHGVPLLDRHSVKVVYGPTGSGTSTEAARIGTMEARVVFAREVREASDALDLLRSVGWNPLVCEVHARDETGARDRIGRLFADAVLLLLPESEQRTPSDRGGGASRPGPDEVAGRLAAARLADPRARHLGEALLDAWCRARLEFVPAPRLREQAVA